MCRLSLLKTHSATPRPTRDRCACANDWRTVFRSEVSTHFKSIDDASSIGAGTTVGSGGGGLGAGGTGAAGGGASASAGSGANSVAQNPFNLAGERGLSSFNQTQKFTADYLLELPFGHDKRWLTGNTPWRAILGDWQWSGDRTLASGLPFTPRFVGDASEISGGTNGTLRPDVVPGNRSSSRIPRLQSGLTPRHLLLRRPGNTATRAATALSALRRTCLTWR